MKIIEDGPTTLLKSTILNHPDFQSLLAIAILKHLFWSIFAIIIVVIIKISIIILLTKCIINYIKNWNSRNKNNEEQQITNNTTMSGNKIKSSFREKVQNIFRQSKSPQSIELKEIETQPLTSKIDNENSKGEQEQYLEKTIKNMTNEISKIRNNNKSPNNSDNEDKKFSLTKFQ